MKFLSNEIETHAKTKLSFALCTVLALSAASLSADDKDKYGGAPDSASTKEVGKSGQLSSADEKFITEACHGSKIEVKMSKLGVQRAQNEQVKQFAQRMIDDHSKAGTELKQLASSKGCAMPESEDQISGIGENAERTQVREKTDAHPNDKAMAEFKREWSKLENASGTEFDRQYVSMTVKCHERSVKEFEKASNSADDADVKSFAAKTLPTLREHLSQAKTLQASVGAIGAPGEESGTDTGKSKSDDLKP